MKKILLILAAGCTMALVSCEEWLDKYPLAQMSPETFFSNENELQAFSNKFYTAFPSDGLYNEYWDNIIHNDLPQEMRGGRTIPRVGRRLDMDQPARHQHAARIFGQLQGHRRP